MAPTIGEEWGASTRSVLAKAAALSSQAERSVGKVGTRAGAKELVRLAQEELKGDSVVSGDLHAQASAKIALVNGLLGLGQFEEAEKLAANVLVLFRELGLGACHDDFSTKGSEVSSPMILSAAAASKRRSALQKVSSSFLLFREVGVPRGEVTALVRTARQYLCQGQIEEGLLLAKEAMQVAQRVDDEGLQAVVMLLTADLFLQAGKPEEALKASHRARSLAKNEKDEAAEAAACLRHSRANSARKITKAGIESAREAAALFRKVEAAEDTVLVATALVALGEAHLLSETAKSASEALGSGEEAMNIFKAHDDKAGEASALLVIAGAEELRENREAALEAARAALALARRSGQRSMETKARDICARLRKQPSPPKSEPQASIAARMPSSCNPGLSAPAVWQKQPMVGATRIMGSAESKRLSGMITLVTGASRGIGKGIALALAEAGAIVYVTGRSSPGKETDVILMGTVDETVSAFSKLGGTGVAAHVDHAQDSQNKALAELIEETHGRLDICVNNAFYIPKPDVMFFNHPVWNQPIRFLNEQAAVGHLNHAEQTLTLLPSLRQGKGVVINISSWGSQQNIGVFPASYLCNKASFDKTSAALSEKLRDSGVYMMTLWPGNVKSERSVTGAKRTGKYLVDMETARFTGHAVVELGSMRPEQLRVYSAKHRTISSADVQSWDVDGYLHQGDLHTFTTGGRQ
eukprot:TRINITY_DN51494_c0_g1_i1.p1 TRINITY_DN51494_c0_g1~~TRINITY_DN51494_c0_g1_i1.p1  ORF type:complete len:700 (+),score=152.94 TRINITY_DN51494_c0_g1_i1:61-2160(+)